MADGGRCGSEGARDWPNAMRVFSVEFKCGWATLVINGSTMSSASTTDSMAKEIPSDSLRRRRSHDFVTASPSTRHRLRADSVVSRSGSGVSYVLFCMDAPSLWRVEPALD